MVILGHHIYYEMQSVSQKSSVKWLDDSNMLGKMSEVAVVPDLTLILLTWRIW